MLQMSHEKETTNLASADYQKHGSPTTAEIKVTKPDTLT